MKLLKSEDLVIRTKLFPAINFIVNQKNIRPRKIRLNEETRYKKLSVCKCVMQMINWQLNFSFLL